MFTLLKRIFKAGWQAFSRDGAGLAIANVFILVLTISLITSIFLLKDVSRFLISKIEEKADISVYFKEDVAEQDIMNIEEKIAKIPEVKKVDYISKESALNDFIERHKGEETIIAALEELGSNPFLSSLNIQANEVNQYEVITNFFDEPEYKDVIEKIDYYKRKPLIERIFTLTTKINQGGLVFALILITISVLITFNTIRLSILNFGEEISIQRLVGASNWFIRGPFIIQGVIYGFFATVICMVIFSLLIWFISPKIEVSLTGLSLFNIFIGNFWRLILFQLVAGIGLGVVSSLIAIRRYLKV